MAGDMRGLTRDDRGLALARVPVPVPARGEVVIDVAYAGVCRTDLAVADGSLVVAAGRIVGHELAGRVSVVGDGATRAIGERVTVIPFAACGTCEACVRTERCLAPRWLGIDRDGAFADQVCVPASCALPLPAALSLAVGAYVEPVAAALGVLPAIERGMRVLIAGDGRIAELTARVVAAAGAEVVRHAGVRVDVAIEHGGELGPLLAALRPGGTLVLKSRLRRAVALPAGELVARELTVRGASHGSFPAAIDWLCTGRIVVDDLLARPRPLEEFVQVFADARASEVQKPMFAITERA